MNQSNHRVSQATVIFIIQADDIMYSLEQEPRVQHENQTDDSEEDESDPDQSIVSEWDNDSIVSLIPSPASQNSL